MSPVDEYFRELSGKSTLAHSHNVTDTQERSRAFQGGMIDAVQP